MGNDPTSPPPTSMPPLFLRSAIVACAVATAGCAGSGMVAEHPVDQPPPPLKPGVYRVENVAVRPVAVHEVEPPDPPELGSILSGNALVVFTVRPDGKVTDASVLQADDVLFGEAAVKAILKWRFRPAEVNGAPVACRMTMPFTFTAPYGYYIDNSSGPPSTPDSPPSGAHETKMGGE